MNFVFTRLLCTFMPLCYALLEDAMFLSLYENKEMLYGLYSSGSQRERIRCTVRLSNCLLHAKLQSPGICMNFELNMNFVADLYHR